MVKIGYFTNIHGNLGILKQYGRVFWENHVNFVIGGGDFSICHEEIEQFYKEYTSSIIDNIISRGITFIQTFGDLDIPEKFPKVLSKKFITMDGYKPFTISDEVEWKILQFPVISDNRYMLSNNYGAELKLDPEFCYGQKLMFDVKSKNYNNTRLIGGDSPSFLQDAELAILSKTEINKNTIFVCHQPPYGTEISLDVNKIDRGSYAVKDFINEKPPGISLHGHIEPKDIVEIMGKTICLNPGTNRFMIIELDSKVKGWFADGI